MRAFTCEHCGQLLFFENSLCLRCGASLGFVPSRRALMVPDRHPEMHLEPCGNQAVAACNWMLEPDSVPWGGAQPTLCRSCGLTRTRPADFATDDLAQFAVAERAKRRLLFGLLDLGLPIGDDLRFDLLSSRNEPVTIGHDGGVITIDLAESDDARRELRRTQLEEPYRTMLGHFRHEIGHYYWPILVVAQARLERARELFGDERLDYDEARERHYSDPRRPPADWAQRHVSAYATMHPYEDWAETFAHYLHIRDTLQTAGAFGIVVAVPGDGSLISTPGPDAGAHPFQKLLADWLPLTYALNAVNRSMGRDDLYPFTLAPTVIDKLSFVHDRVQAGKAGVAA